MIFKKGSLCVRRLQQDDNILLAKWLSNPEVLEFYEGRDNPFDLEKVNRTFYNTSGETVRCMVEYERNAIGYIQYYRVNEETSEIHDYAETEVIYGMDQFIGETPFWNKGIGTLLVSAMVDFLITEKKADRVIMDPQILNRRALKCYEKCGLERLEFYPSMNYMKGYIRIAG